MSHTIRDQKKLLARVRRLRGQIDGIERALAKEAGDFFDGGEGQVGVGCGRHGRFSASGKFSIPIDDGAISAKKSFGVEYRDWIEAHGAQRRDITGGERDSGKYKGDASERG